MSVAAPRPCDGSQGGEAAPRGVATGVKAPERGPSPPRALLRLPLLLPGFALALPMRPLLTRGPGQILWALAPGRLVPLATWHPYPHRSLLLALSTAAPVADTAGHSRLGSRAVTQPPRRSGPGATDGVAQTGRSAAAPAAATSWGLPRQSGPEWQLWKMLPATGHASSLLGTGRRVARRPLPGLRHVSTGQRDPPSGQTFL